MTEKNDADKVVIFDTTLRDGEQCPGASMGLGEKMQVAKALARLNVDIIEAGFPIASPGDFEAVQKIAETVKGPIIAGLARCVDKDIEAAAEAVAPAGDKGRIHVFLATSAIHREFKLRKAKAEIIKAAVAGVTKARSLVADVQFSPEDASRTELDFLAEVTEAVIDAGATTINIPDTVGYTVPAEFGRCIAYLKENVRNIDQAIIHVHCHDDLGLAVANSLEAIRHGARGVECTLNGIGERAGNCSLEEIVMGLKTRSDFYGGLWTGINTKEIYRTSRLVSQLTGLHVQRNKAIVGANAFAHESGIHQDGMLKERSTYEIMNPEDIGLTTGSELVLGKHSGRHAFREHIQELGFKLEDDALQKAFEDFINLADKKKNIYDDDLVAILQQNLDKITGAYVLKYLHVSTGTTTVPTATIRLEKDGVVHEDAACGDGPVDAALNSIERITQVKTTLTDFALQSITSGKDAQAEVTVTVRFEDKTLLTGKGSSTDIVEAGAKAYLNCINRYLAKK
jgi:2-isopropylmalate synthase